MFSLPAVTKPVVFSGGRARGIKGNRSGLENWLPRPAMASLLKVDPEVKIKVWEEGKILISPPRACL